MTKNILQIHPDDNLIVALETLPAGESIDVNGETVTLLEEIPGKHKFALNDFATGEHVTMYGVTVGKTSADIKSGARITTENLKHDSDSFSDRQGNYQWDAPNVDKWKSRTFEGFLRPDGRVGTNNYWLVIPLVFCENRNVSLMRETVQDVLGYGRCQDYRNFAQGLAQAYNEETNPQDVPLTRTAAAEDRLFPNVDGVKFLLHDGGCGGMRSDAETLCQLLAGYIDHPNVAGATIFSLGCQNAQVSLLQEEINKVNPNFDKPLIVLEQQKIGSEEEVMERALRETFAELAAANKFERSSQPLSHLTFGVECGGSDGFSGISANPLMGRVIDRLIALGGNGILAEFPELCGVEQQIVNRCANDELAERFTSLIKAYKRSAADVGASFDMNPSPGNIKDGLITDAMKSCGASLKGGSAPINGVYDYPEVVRGKGLNLLCTPGNDVESTTALAGSGAHLILFSTGLGTPTGNPIIPVIKVSSTNVLKRRMDDIIDFSSGDIITGEKGLDELAEELLALCVDACSGSYESKSQILGQDDFLPWKRGISL
ncbi:MAG: altronate dehydratase [Lentisphaeraceae bacterium]|nr:altronate dehydratase [Lentisphaeraceae bacterium]